MTLSKLFFFFFDVIPTDVLVGVNLYHGDPCIGTSVVPPSQLRAADDLHTLGYGPLWPEAKAPPRKMPKGSLGAVFPAPRLRKRLSVYIPVSSLL